MNERPRKATRLTVSLEEQDYRTLNEIAVAQDAQDRSDQSGDGGLVREDPDDLGAAVGGELPCSEASCSHRLVCLRQNTVNSSATSSFFDSFPAEVLGRFARNSILVGISYLASLSAKNALSRPSENGQAPGFSVMKALAD
jgi:hypothetical protein